MTSLIVENAKNTVQKVERIKRGLTKRGTGDIITKLSQDGSTKVYQSRKNFKKSKKST